MTSAMQLHPATIKYDGTPRYIGNAITAMIGSDANTMRVTMEMTDKIRDFMITNPFK